MDRVEGLAVYQSIEDRPACRWDAVERDPLYKLVVGFLNCTSPVKHGRSLRQLRELLSKSGCGLRFWDVHDDL
ncbi:MAG: hypothetical protein ABSE56_09725 [Bryobacteraceae bacterium]|jgi:hypothetical protein